MRPSLLVLIAMLVISTNAWAQTRKVSGRILDETGQGLIGAAVSVPGTTLGTVTDIDGNFSLDVPNENNTVLVRALNYIDQTITIPANNEISVRMALSQRELETVVVTALGVRREKREIGYSATTLNNDDLTNAGQVSALSAINGKTAGVNITSTTGGPGGSTRVVLRGEKSVNGNNNALIVVDGIPINNSSRLAGIDERYQIDFGNQGNDINPEDIESITVLKGPAAAALYGSIGANGAIMITTKSGRARTSAAKNSVAFESKLSFSNILMLPEFQNKYGQGDVYNIEDDRRENFSWGLPFDDQLRPWGQEINGRQRVKPYSAQPDNVRDFFKTGTTTENNLSLGGSNDMSSYYLSINTLNNKGVIPNNFYDKYSMRLNASYNMPNKMYSSINLNYINTYSRVESNGQGDEGVYNNLLQQPRDIPIQDLKDLNNPFNGYGIIDETGVSHYGYYGAYANNPYWIVQNVDNRNRTDRVLGNAIIGIRPDSNWNIYNRIGVDYISDRVYSKTPKIDDIPFDPFYSAGGSPLRHTLNGGYFESNTNNQIFYDDLIANYNNDITKDIGFDGLVGANLQYNRLNVLSGRIDNQTNGLIIPGYYNLNNNEGPIEVDDRTSETRQVGLYGSLRFDYQDMVFLELTARNDWTSTLSPGNWSYFYPSANLSWIFTQTFKDAAWTQRVLTYGKLRGGFASVGNGALAYQNNAPLFSRTESATGFGSIRFPFAEYPGFTYGNIIGNADLRPERTNSFEVGLELSFFGGRGTLDATYYNNRSIDQIVGVATASSTGFDERVVNLGEIANNGIELAARVAPVQTRTGFRWELYGTYYKNNNKVVDLANGEARRIILGGVSGAGVYAAIGQPFGAIYATDIMTNANGQVVVDSATGMPRLTDTLIYKGTYQPRFVASWGTTIRYKNLALNVLFDTKQGGVFFTRTKDIMDFVGTAKETEDREEQVWENSVYMGADGQYHQNTTPYAPYNYYTNVIPSGQHVVDASFIKLREASLTYSFPQRWLDKTMFGSARVSVYGNNLFIWTAKENKYADPEMSAGGATNLQGFEYSSRPSLRNYGISLRFTF
jgi:TonB-linked SusC/RagA family outer membrane protein